MKKLCIAIAAAALLPAGALAKDGKDPHAACRADMERLCGNVKPGEGRQVKCMMDNRTRVSSACGELLQKKHEKEQAWQRNKVKH
jgi:hypothetical protein